MSRDQSLQAAQPDGTPPHGDPVRPQLPAEQEREQQARPPRKREQKEAADEHVPPPPTHPPADPLKGPRD